MLSHPELQHAEAVAYAAQGHRDAMGTPFSGWQLARYHEDGRALRDAHGRQMFMTHAEWMAKYGTTPASKPKAPTQTQLFA